MLVAVYLTQIALATKHASTIYVVILATVDQMLNVELKTTNQSAHVNKATMEIQRFNALKLDAHQIRNVQKHILASIDNVYRHVLLTEVNAVNELSVME